MFNHATRSPNATEPITLQDNFGPIAICQVTVGETLKLQGNDGRIGVHDSFIGNALIVQGNTAYRINLRGNDVGSTGGGSINVQDKTTTVRLVLLDNHTANNLNCTGNVAAPTGTGNTADNHLNDQCELLG